MSKLYYTEQGGVISTLNEELTHYRRARKVLPLPGTAQPAALYLLARPAANAGPLHISVNGHALAPVTALPGPAVYLWYQATVPPEWLMAGANTFEFWGATPAMTGWSLAMEHGHPQPQSFISDDAGQTWRNQNMCYLNASSGEYVVRLRLAEGADPAPPAMLWEDPRHPRLENLRRLLPAAALDDSAPRLTRIQALSTWLSQSWTHTHTAHAAQYTPWDAETILAWGGSQIGHDGRRPIAMCVHYGVAFVTACQALGLPARCAVFNSEINTFDGHFVAEAWLEEYQKWILVDPNADALFVQAGVPLSVSEAQAAGADLSPLVQWGPGAAGQRAVPHMETFVQANLLKGLYLRRRSLWPRADFLTHPEHTPPGHGATAYCETGLVWAAPAGDPTLGMFPYFGDDAYFDAPPR